MAGATLTELELTEDVLEARQSLRGALFELSGRSRSVKSVRLTNWVMNASSEIVNQPQVQESRVENETLPGSLTGVRFDVATQFGRPNTTPLLVCVPNLTSSNRSSINLPQYSVQTNAIQPQTEPTNPDPVSLMAQQIATSKPNSSFTVPTNHVLPKLSAWTIPTIGCSVANGAISQLYPQDLSRAPNTNSDNNTTVLYLARVTNGGAV